MRRIGVLVPFSAAVCLALSGCSRTPAPPNEPASTPSAASPNAVPLLVAENPGFAPRAEKPVTAVAVDKPYEFPIPIAAEPSLQEKYDAALLEALNLLAERKTTDALAALEKARAIQDTEQIRAEITRVRKFVDEQAAAERVVQDIRTVLSNGKPEEASRLASGALQQYGGADVAASLTLLKREADALMIAQVNDNAGRRERFRQEAEAALRDRNLRAAALAFEQALQYSEDAGLRGQLEEVRAALSRYDDNRRRAAELRRDSARLEEALAALQEAARAWDTAQVRQEIDDCTVALQKRRDRISVADFEVRGDLGIAVAGRTIAEELLPAFKPRFDLVEREQLGKVLEELRLEASDLANNAEGQQALSKLARVRYLVVGSVTPLSGLTVYARLIEVNTGLVVQTAKLVCPTPADLMRRLPQLALLLQMTDEQRMAFEQQLVAQAQAEVQPVAIAPLPPPPPPPVVSQPPPPPIVVYTPRPPALGGLVIADLERLPPAAPPQLSVDVVIARNHPVNQRLLQVSVELGDNLFRRGRYKEAQHHFELALTFASDRQAIQLRLDSCRTLAPPPPPPPVVVVAPPPVVIVRPRIAVFNFLVNCNPGLVPVGFGDWAADCLSPYFGQTHEVIDRGEVCWWMGRLGITMRDVLQDAGARQALAQALNARFFLFGAIQQTASFDVSTHLVDAATGQKKGSGSIHVQDQQELKLRMPELVQQTTRPADQQRLAQESKERERILNDARRQLAAGQYAQAAEVSRTALQRSPDNLALKAVLAQAEQQAQKAALEEARQREAERLKALAETARQQQAQLAQQAEAARQKAEQEAKARDEASRRAQDTQRQRAHDQLVAQAQLAVKQGNYQQAIPLLESAVALKPGDAASRELPVVKAKLDEATRAKAAAEQAQREAAARKQQEEELAKARARVEEERKQREAAELARRKIQEERDQAEYLRLVDHAKALVAKQQFDPALAILQSARRLKQTEEVDRLMAQARDGQMRVETQKKSEQARADAERKQAEEKAHRDQAEAAAKKQQQLADEARKKQEDDKRAEKVRQFVATARKALDAGQLDAAATAIAEAKKLALPNDLAVAKAQFDLDQARSVAATANATKKKPQATAPQTAKLDTASPKPPPKVETPTPQPAAQPKPTVPAPQPVPMPAVQSKAEPQPPKTPTQAASTPAPAIVPMPQPKPMPAPAPTPKPMPAPAASSQTPPMPQPKTQTPAPSPPVPLKAAPPPEYVTQLQAALALEKQQKYSEALTAYKKAAALAPNDAKATRGIEFCQHMSDGQKALAAQKLTDAAREFEAALRAAPGNADATAALKKARAVKP